MSRESLIVLIGFTLIFAPFLGILEIQKQYFIAGLGAVLIFIGYSLRRSRYLRQLERGNGERGNDSFVERYQERIDYGDARTTAREYGHEYE
jgi:uncharacterized membrane protein